MTFSFFVKRVRVVANKIRDQRDEQFVLDSIPAEDLLGMIHYNPEIMDAPENNRNQNAYIRYRN